MVTVARHWSMEAPAEWETALRAFSPISDVVPWLALRWFPMKQKDEYGFVRDAGRWVLYECVSESLAKLADPLTDIFELLKGPQPSRIRDPNAAAAKALYASDYQCAMYRKHGVWARNLWIIQGTAGGHPVEYTQQEQKWLQAADQPTDPPALGTLPYAPFDARVIAQMRNRNRLMRLGGSLERLRASGATLTAEWEAAEREFRRQHIAQVEESTAGVADFLRYYASSSKTATECRNTVPEMDRATANAAEIAAEMYIETGRLPVAFT